ncbi:ATP-binding protein [Ligilactobacillus salivarius]
MKLIRGGNIQQLQAIQSVRIFREDYQIVRPMLIFNKKEIYDYAKQLGLNIMRMKLIKAMTTKEIGYDII